MRGDWLIESKIPPDDRTLEIIAQVAELAGVTSQETLFGIDSCTFGDAIYCLILEHQNVKLSRKKEALVKAHRAVRAAKAAILILDKRDQAALRYALYNWVTRTTPPASAAEIRCWVQDVCNRWPDLLLIALSEMTGGKPFIAPAKGRRRPKGAAANWQLQKFVRLLWRTADLYGGSLYADHKRPDGGTMIKALHLLAPLLPAGFIPNIPPTATIESVIKNFKASGRTTFEPRRIP